MVKICFIGAGSLGFTRNLVRDILTFPLLKDATLSLMDIDPERLDFSRKAVQAIIDKGGYPARVEATPDRREALKDADAVLCTILAAGIDVWRHDIEIPKRYGVDINVGDTRGPAGVFRAMRTIPVMLSIVKDMEEMCPKAILLNYTNPMAMLCRAMQMNTSIPVTGLCHSVQGTASMLAGWIGADMSDVDYVCAGINHMAWFLKYNVHGKDAYPQLLEAMDREEVYREEIVRNELFLKLGYYITESSGHNSEYNWWFRKRPELIEKYCAPGTGWNPGEYAYILNDYLEKEETWKTEVQEWFQEGAPIELERGQEYAAYIINAYVGGEPFEFNGNVANTGLITNLPPDVCVEVPVLVNRRGYNPMHVGDLPDSVLPMNMISVLCEELAVKGTLEGDPQAIFQSIAYDPLTSSVLSLDEIRDMVNELFEVNREHLPTFSRFSV